MNKVSKLFSALALSGAAFASTHANAATIAFDLESNTVNVGDTFQVTLVGRDWVDGVPGTYGGGVSVAWDASVLSLLSYDTSVFGGDQLLAGYGSTTALDNAIGSLANLSVNSAFVGVDQANFDIAVLTFSALALGQSDLIASLGKFDNGFDNIWTDYGDGVNAMEITPTFVNASVSAVPLPGSIYLFGGALMGLAGFAHRRKA